MTVRIKADEHVGNTGVEPYIAVTLERTAELTDGLESVTARGVNNIRISIGFREPATFSLPPRHLNGLIDLLETARRRLNDTPEESA